MSCNYLARGRKVEVCRGPLALIDCVREAKWQIHGKQGADSGLSSCADHRICYLMSSDASLLKKVFQHRITNIVVRGPFQK